MISTYIFGLVMITKNVQMLNRSSRKLCNTNSTLECAIVASSSIIYLPLCAAAWIHLPLGRRNNTVSLVCHFLVIFLRLIPSAAIGSAAVSISTHSVRVPLFSRHVYIFIAGAGRRQYIIYVHGRSSRRSVNKRRSI